MLKKVESKENKTLQASQFHRPIEFDPEHVNHSFGDILEGSDHTSREHSASLHTLPFRSMAQNQNKLLSLQIIVLKRKIDQLQGLLQSKSLQNQDLLKIKNNLEQQNRLLYEANSELQHFNKEQKNTILELSDKLNKFNSSQGTADTQLFATLLQQQRKMDSLQTKFNELTNQKQTKDVRQDPSFNRSKFTSRFVPADRSFAQSKNIQDSNDYFGRYQPQNNKRNIVTFNPDNSFQRKYSTSRSKDLLLTHHNSSSSLIGNDLTLRRDKSVIREDPMRKRLQDQNLYMGKSKSRGYFKRY